MPGNVGVNGRTVVHAQSKGQVTFFPDVCLTPSPPAGPVPIPYPNTAMSSDADKGAKSVTVDGNPILTEGSVFATSTGDEAGSNGGVVSGVTKGEAKFILGSVDVMAEGKMVARALDQMTGNKGNTAPMPELQPPLVAMGKQPGDLKPDALVVIVNGADGKALAGVKYVLETPDGQKLEGKTDGSGKIEVKETVRGIGRITFPELPEGTHVEMT
jgi:hypothetical protein